MVGVHLGAVASAAEGLCPAARAAPRVGSKGRGYEIAEKLEARAERASLQAQHVAENRSRV